MSDAIINVEGLGKRYFLAHEVRHDTLRDSLAHGVRGLWSKVRLATRPTTSQEEFWALRDASFEINRGEVVGIIGRNGAGKSTLLKILSRITEPTAGRARIRGRVASLLEVGTGFHPELTGRENIFLNGAILGMPRVEIRRKFDEIVAFAEVERFLDSQVKFYSSGMYVRLAFAVAAHLEPDILIVDEVLAVGDANFQAKCLGKMEAIAQKEARTVLFVSHNISAVARFCPRTMLLDRGRIVLDTRTDAAINGYVNIGRAATETEIKLSTSGYSHGAPLKLISLILNGGTPLINRQPLTATFKFYASRAVSGGFGLGFSTVDGRRLLTLESDYTGKGQQIPSSGEYTITLRLPVFDLTPGRYCVDVGAYSDQHQGYHYQPDCAIADVQPGPATPAHLHGFNGDWRPPSEWELSDRLRQPLP